ncbi:MAG: LysM peptidoglycan-binding domain-containing protein [Caldilineaceae bacterium]
MRIALRLRRQMMFVLLISILLVSLVPMAAIAAPNAAPVASGSYYIVRPGDTLSQIARYYSVSIQSLMAANGLWNANLVRVGQRLYIPAADNYTPPSPACYNYYRVRPGDTISGIAAWLGVNAWSLASANGLSNWNSIYVGQRLCVPNVYVPPAPAPAPSGYYTVRAGDTLSSIALRFGISPHHLAWINGISNPNYIYVGQVLRIA